jgi:hypothetical protein
MIVSVDSLGAVDRPQFLVLLFFLPFLVICELVPPMIYHSSCQVIVLVKNSEALPPNSNFQLVLTSICPGSACIASVNREASILDISYNIDRLVFVRFCNC